jgi:TPP-dependent indolepyruvate ferredoxin oxidoreductase alpha subunit
MWAIPSAFGTSGSPGLEEEQSRCTDFVGLKHALVDMDGDAKPELLVTDDCNGCTMCFRIGCPAISKSEVLDEKYKRPKSYIDPLQCVGCGLCYDVCAPQAILEGALKAEATLTTHVA